MNFKTILSILALGSGAALPMAEAAVIYRETFGNNTGENATLSTVGWTATVMETTGWGSSSNAGRTQDLDNVNAGTSASLTNGYAYYGNATITANSLIYTTEYTIAQSVVPQLGSISWYQGNANDSVGNRVAVNIEGVWYVTADSFTSPAVSSAGDFAASGPLTTFTWTNAASAWRELTVSGSTVTLGATLTEDLPLGDITAFGVFVSSGTGIKRLDTFEIQTIPEPEAVVMGGVGMLLLLMKRRRAWAGA